MTEQTLPSADDAFDEVIDDRKSWIRESGAPLVTFALLILIWELAADYFKIPTWLLPSPTTIGGAFVEWRAELFSHTLTTLYETLVGFALSIAIAVPLAVAVVYSPFLRNTIYPILLALQSMPKVAIAPLLALWIGFGTLPKIVVVFLVCFFPIIVSNAN